MVSFNEKQVMAELIAEEILEDIPEELSVAEFFYSGSALLTDEDDNIDPTDYVTMNRTQALDFLNDEEN